MIFGLLNWYNLLNQLYLREQTKYVELNSLNQIYKTESIESNLPVKILEM